MIISCEKQKTPNRPPFRVPSKMFPESATIFSPSNILKRIKPILGRCKSSHLEKKIKVNKEKKLGYPVLVQINLDKTICPLL